jgi:hypothetical protein
MRFVLGFLLACAGALGACKEPTWRTLWSGLSLRVLPDCAPERAERVLIEPLGHFPASPEDLVSVPLADAPVRLEDLPVDTLGYRLALETGDFDGLSLARAGSAGERFDALLLPEARACTVRAEALPALEGSAQALIAGADLLIAGGTEAGQGVQRAWVLRVADPGLAALEEDRDLAVERAGAAAVSLEAETWLLGGATNASVGNAALDSFERFDVASGSFTGALGRMRARRYRPAALRLPDGSVLVAGGAASVGGEQLTSIETIAPDGKGSTLWSDDQQLPVLEEVALSLRDDGRVVALGADAASVTHVALLDPQSRATLELTTLDTPELDYGAGVALPGARFAVFELRRGAAQLDESPTTGRLQLLLDGGDRFLTLSDWLGSFAGLYHVRAMALANGRVLLTGLRRSNDAPEARVLNLGNREVATRPLDLRVDALFMRDDGSVLMVGADGARVLREDALSRFDNPGGTLIADDSQVLCLDAYGRFTREGLGLRAAVNGARFDLAPLRYQDVRITLSVEGPAQLWLRPPNGDARLIDLGGEVFGPAFCQLAARPGESLELTREEERITLRAGGESRSCQLAGIRGEIALGLSAVQEGTLVRELRAERL